MKLILIKSGFRNKTAAALFGMNWQLRNNHPVVFKEENFVMFSLYNVYYTICEKETIGLTIGGRPVPVGGN